MPFSGLTLLNNTFIAHKRVRWWGVLVAAERNPPHFHAEYGLVMEWADLHIKELLDNWDILKETGKCRKIKPLV